MKNIYKILLIILLISIWTIPMATPASACGGSTHLDISASATEVSSGDTIQLTISETNDGDVRLDNVSVDLYEGSTFLMTISGDPPWVDGDPGTRDLDIGETWSWEVTVTVITNTTYTAIGYAEEAPDWASGEPPITWPDDEDEKDSIDVTVTNGCGGCTPGYWKNHLDSWTGYDPTDNFLAIFGDGPDISLLDAVNMKGGKFKALVRHAAAALLNAAHPDVDYPYDEVEIFAMVQEAYATGDWETPKDDLEEANELGCELD